MRIFVLAAVLHGLVPGLGGIVESAFHYATTGHLAHSPGETDLDDAGAEHSCGVTLHTCGCCAGQPVTSDVGGAVVEEGGPSVTRRQLYSRDAVDRDPARPFRPPIA